MDLPSFSLNRISKNKVRIPNSIMAFKWKKIRLFFPDSEKETANNSMTAPNTNYTAKYLLEWFNLEYINALTNAPKIEIYRTISVRIIKKPFIKNYWIAHHYQHGWYYVKKLKIQNISDHKQVDKVLTHHSTYLYCPL